MYIIIIINISYNNSAAHGTDSFQAFPEPLGNGETSFQQRQQQPTLLTPLCELRDCGRNASFLFVPFAFASNLSTHGAAMLVHFLPIKSWKRSARDVIDTSAIHAGLAYDVTDTLLTGKTWQHSRSCLHDFTNVSF